MGERLQERPQRRRGAEFGEDLGHRPVPQDVHVLDAVGAGEHAGDQDRDFLRGVRRRRTGQPQVLAQEVEQPGLLGQRHRWDQAGVGDQVRFIEDHHGGRRSRWEDLRDLHAAGVFLAAALEL